MRRIMSALLLCTALSAPAAAEPSPGYAIVVSEATLADPAWKDVVTALEAKHAARGPFIVTWQKSPAEAVAALSERFPRHTCFVARPEEASREFVAQVHQLARRLDDDPYTDTLWGILTGFDAANFNINVGATNGTGGFANALAPDGFFGVRQQGNVISLTYTVPEPSVYALLALSGAALGAHILRRRRK